MTATPTALRLLEALLFASDQPMTERELKHYLPEGANLSELLSELEVSYQGRGVNLVQSGKSWSFVTAADLAPLIAKAGQNERKLSRAATETLAIIAYHQPITRSELEELRGVHMGRGTLDVLYEQGWIATKGRRQTPGRPMQWGTTLEFLRHFGLESLRDLPEVEDLRSAGLLDLPVNATEHDQDSSAPCEA